MKVKIWTAIYFGVSFLDIYGVYIDSSVLQYIFKPLIMISLLLLYGFSAKIKNKWFILALSFSFIGDVLLLDKQNLFIFGIAAFLLTQILYIKIILDQLKKSTFRLRFISTIPFAIFYILLIWKLWKNLNEFLIPVIIYGLVISIFGIFSFLNHQMSKTKISRILLMGAVLFIASDSMIALHKFNSSRNFYPVAIMITYVLAQYLIFHSMIRVNSKVE